jgi:uncharacterized protein YcaQ
VPTLWVMLRSRSAQLSARESRWVAIEAQQLGRPRPRRKAGATREQVERTAGALGAVQLDAVNVLVRTQFLVLFSRLGHYERPLLTQLTGPRGELWEYWGHAASLMPSVDEPLFRWRYEIGGTHEPGPKIKARVEASEAASAEYFASVMLEVTERGALTARELVDPRPRSGEWWDRRSAGREALARLHALGRLATWRSSSFESVYDLPERVLLPEVLVAPTPSPQDAKRALLLKAARAIGVGTTTDIAGYYMIKPTVAKPLIADMVGSGELLTVSVEGWKEPAYIPAGTEPRAPTRSTATLLSPFDSLVWDRRRTSRLFGFDYRIEVYVPAAQRVFGYYVLPLLLGDSLVARLDLKADRKASVLRVAGAFLENGSDVGAVAPAAAAELSAIGSWLGLDGIEVVRNGNLAAAIRVRLEG